MKTYFAPAKVKKAFMNCMEIQGGSGSTNNHFSRPGLDIWLSSQSQASTKAGGSDLYLLSSCASGRITRMLLADVCDNGSGFTKTAINLRELMKININTIRQARFVRQLSDQLENDSQRGCFATMVLSTYFTPTRRLTLCNAGHAPPLLFRATSQKWSILKQVPHDQSVDEPLHGVVGRDEYQEFETQLEIGDMVLSYSSALPECHDERGHTMGCEGVLNRVRNLDTLQPAKLAASLVNGIRRDHSENLAREDGTTMLCQATPNKVPWLDNVLAPLRFLQAVSDKSHFIDDEEGVTS
jgi:sigma-B regulation protein RsbU (phosphoserine phosphatase)